MRPKSSPKLSVITAVLAAGGALLAAVAPARAQSSVEELTVTGRYGPLPDNVRSISQTVSYADLDLSTGSGRRELKRRIALTARYLCDRLGESDTSSGAIPSCREAAVQDASRQANAVIAHFPPRGATWVAGPVWTAPYPTTWVEKYPD